MTIKIVNGKKLYPVGLFNRLNHVYDMFMVRYVSNQLEDTEKNDLYAEAIRNAYDFQGMYYAEWKYYKVLKDLV